MSNFDSIIESLQNEDYPTKKQLLEYTLHVIEMIRKTKKELDREDAAALLAYAQSEMDHLLDAIPKTATYKEKDLLFACEDLLLGIIMLVYPSRSELSDDILAKIKLLVETVAKERYIETYIDGLFGQDAIEKAEMDQLVAMLSPVEDEYQRGKLYAGLVNYKNDLDKITDDAKKSLIAYLTAEMNRYLTLANWDEECVNSLEVAADICKYFPDDTLIALLRDVMKRGYSNVNFFAVETLLTLGQSVPADCVTALARDLVYADMTYHTLVKFGKGQLFPAECTTPEYLAKSDLVHWLTYPTELGKVPDEIEYIGKITYLFKKDVYHVFKYRSDSDNLDENLKNKWLIGWSNEDGGTFSQFDEYAQYEKETVKATLNNIKKKLIG